MVAVPTASRETCAQLAAEADEVVCGMTPQRFHAVGLWYNDFSELSDDHVRALPARGVAHQAQNGPSAKSQSRKEPTSQS